MRPIYENRKITQEESLHLAEYLSHPEKSDGRSAPVIKEVLWFAWIGVGVFFVLLRVLNKQRKGATRKNLLQKHLQG